jgi:dCMP deaminase
MTDIEKHNNFLNMCQLFANFSKCVSRKVGCLIVKDGRIIASGCNGTPAGTINCNDIFKNYDDNIDRIKHHEFSDNYEVHAEINAVLMCAKYGISIKDTSMYVNLQPCNHCLKMICNSGIKNIYFNKLYNYSNYEPLFFKILNDLNIKLNYIKDNKCFTNEEFLNKEI